MAELATIARPYAEAMFKASSGADLRISNRSARDFYLVVPERISARTAAAAAQVAASGPGSAERLAALATFFRDRRLVYAQDDLPGGIDPVDTFLFEKRRGYCEFFAAAYVTLARLAGLPARLVGGYYGGEYNALGGYYLVTDDTAHVWVEVLTDEGLWQRVDPSQWASNAGTVLGTARLAGLGHDFGLKVMMHCCGGFFPLIPAMIEAGIDALQALQPDARDMAPARLKAAFGGRIVFNGSIDTHNWLIEGTPELARARTRETLAVMMPGGGYIASPSHDYLLPETKVENVFAFYETVREFGKY